jgi:hypothetical protein
VRRYGHRYATLASEHNIYFRTVRAGVRLLGSGEPRPLGVRTQRFAPLVIREEEPALAVARVSGCGYAATVPERQPPLDFGFRHPYALGASVLGEDDDIRHGATVA